jgi:type IV pilus assembly protein PilX
MQDSFTGQFSKSAGLQKGSVLLVSLIMLLLLTLVAVGGMQGTILQERMTGNLRDRDLAFEAAEAALRDGEQALEPNVPISFPNSNGLYRISANNRPDWPADPADNGNGVATYSGTLPGVFAQPRYYIEQIDTIVPPGCDLSTYCEPVYYRITAVGAGGSDNTNAVITTVYRTK